jgi:hypothetical protein
MKEYDGDLNYLHFVPDQSKKFALIRFGEVFSFQKAVVPQRHSGWMKAW